MAKVIRVIKWGLTLRASAGDMLALLGVKQLPAEGMAERVIGGVRVYVAPLVKGWDRRGYLARGRGQRFRGGWQGLRVMAICECGRHIPVGRLHQHVCKGGR